MDTLTTMTIRQTLSESVTNDVYLFTDEGEWVFVENGCYTADGALIYIMDSHGVRRTMSGINPDKPVHVKIYR